jgi:antitoxin (DNA-binding transcriptional repressor) of toxin-antitoxin stability system
VSITVTAVKARQNLGELLNLVSIKHEEVIIERAGKRIARLTAIDDEPSVVNEPVAEEYSVQKNPIKKEPIDFSSIFGTWDDEECRRVMEVIDEIRQAHESGSKPGRLEDIPEGTVPQQPDILDLCGVGKQMWERTGLTPDEYVRKEREEWD